MDLAFKTIKRCGLILAILFFYSPLSAGVFSEIDILVREAAIEKVSSLYSPSEIERVFYEITYSLSEELIPGCDFVIEGEMKFFDKTYNFTSCVIANSKYDMSAFITQMN